MERKRLEIISSGFDEPFPVRPTAATGRAQTLPPLPRAPEFLKPKGPLLVNTRSQDSLVAGPSSKPLDELVNIVPKESPSARPSPSPPFTYLSAPRTSEGSRVPAAPAQISCKGWSISELCRKYPNFREVRRVKTSAIQDELLRIMDKYENVGDPLIVEGWDEHPAWKPELLNLDWLLAEVKDKEMHVRNVYDRRDFSYTLPAFVDMCRKQSVYHEPGEHYRCYWKDAECPSQWKEWLGTILPPELLPGCSGDLLRHLDPSEAVESLMCYLGIGDTYTAAHKDICSSSGHNLMCFSENGGSAFWFMTESRDAPKAAEYFQKVLGEELDWETHVTTLEELSKAPFDVYVAEQKVGDLVLVPPRSVHQVVNHGGLSMKISWSRMTLQGLKTALHSELPIYRRVCRPEQYRIKTILYRSMLHHTGSLQSSPVSKTDEDTTGDLVGINTLDLEYTSSKIDRNSEVSSTPPPQPTIEQRADALRSLVGLFDEVLLEEYAACHNSLPYVLDSDRSGWSVTTETSMRRKLVLVPPGDVRDRPERQPAGACNFACDFCGADIFQSFFECRACAGLNGQSTQPGDGLLVCPTCYVEGRSCECDIMEPVQCRPLHILIADRNRAAEVLRHVTPASNVKAPSDLQESDLSEHKDIRVFEAACTYRALKLKRTTEDRYCRANKDMHTAPSSACLRCPICRIWKCFLHYLRADTHVAEAVLVFAKNEEDLHMAHKDNALRAKQSPLRLYNVHGSKLKNRLMIAAKSFPRCKPWHAKMKTGFYDVEFELEPEPNEEPSLRSPSPTPSSSGSKHRHTPARLDLSTAFIQPLDAGETSPLTSLDSDSPERLAPITHFLEEQAHLPDDSELLLITVDNPDVPLGGFGDPMDSKQHGSSSVSPTTTAVDAGSEVEVSEIVIPSDLQPPRKARQNKAYVEISRPKLPKRTPSPSSDEPEWVDEPLPKKPRSMHQLVSENRQRTVRGRSKSRPEPEATRPSTSRKPKARSASEDDFVGASYGDDLASALSKAVAVETPIFTQPGVERSSGPLSRRPTAVKRVMSPDSDRGASPTRSELRNSTTRPPPARVSPEPLPSSNATRPLPRVKQPGLSVSKIPFKQTTLSPGKLPVTPVSADMEAFHPLKRKRGNPPGIPHNQLTTGVASRPREKRSPRKRARVAQRPDTEVIEIDDEPVLINTSRCRSPAPASRTTSLGPSSRSAPLPPPPPPPPPHSHISHANAAEPSHASTSGQGSSPVEFRAGSHPSDPVPIPVVNLVPASASIFEPVSASAPAPVPAPSAPPAVSRLVPSPSASSALASSSTFIPAPESTQARLSPAILSRTARVDVAQLPTALNGYPILESNAAPARASSLQPMESSDVMAVASMFGMVSRALTSAATSDGVCTELVQKYEDVHRRLDVLESREPLAGQHRPSVDQMDQLLARMQKVEEENAKLRENVQKERAERAEEARSLREEVTTVRDEGQGRIAKLRGEFDKEVKERHHMAARMRKLELEIETFKTSHADCVKKEEVTAIVKGEISSLMLALRNSTEDMVVKALERQQAPPSTASFPTEQRPTNTLPYPIPHGAAGDSRHQLEDSKQDHQPRHGQLPWHRPNAMHGQQRRGGMPGQPPRVQNGQQFGGSNRDQWSHNFHRGGHSNFGSHHNPTHRQLDERNQGPYYNNRRGTNHSHWSSRPESRQSDRGPHPAEDHVGDGRRHEEPVRDQLRRESTPRGRSIDVRSERSSVRSHRERSRSVARSHHSRDTEQDRMSPIHQFEDSPRDVDKTEPSASIETIEDFTLERSQGFCSDTQESSFTRRACKATSASGSCPSPRRRRSRSHSRGRSSRHRARSPRRSASPRTSRFRRSSILSRSHHRSSHRSTSTSRRSQPSASHHHRRHSSRHRSPRSQSRHQSRHHNRSPIAATAAASRYLVPHSDKPIRQ